MSYFLSYDELILVALVGLVLVAWNWWELVACGFERRTAPAEALPIVRTRSVTAPGRIGLPPLSAALRRMRRRSVPQPTRGHRPVKPHHGSH